MLQIIRDAESWFFKQTLLVAGRVGILMKLSARGAARTDLASATGSPWLQFEPV